MTNIELLDSLEGLFANDPTIRVSRTENSITYEKDFSWNTVATAEIFRHEHSVFRHTVELCDGGYKTLDEIVANQVNPHRKDNKTGSYGSILGDIKQGSGKIHGNISGLTYTKTSQKGDLYFKGFTLGLGKDNLNNKVGVVCQKWNTKDIKAPIKEYLSSIGLQRKGIIGTWTGKQIAIAFAIGWGAVFLLMIIIALGYLLAG